MQGRIEKLCVTPELSEFKKEANKLNNLLAQQHILFCQGLTIIYNLCHTNNSLVDQLANIMTYFDDVEEKISKFHTWQDSAKGRLANLPRIEESHKGIVFKEREVCLKQVEA